MLRAAAIAFALSFCLPSFATSQTLNASAKMGRALVSQHCGLCHTKPDLNAPQYGPSLDTSLYASTGEAKIRKAIASGAPDMPGFALMLDSTQISAIVDYIKATSPAVTKHAPAASAPSDGPAVAGDK